MQCGLQGKIGRCKQHRLSNHNLDLARGPVVASASIHGSPARTRNQAQTPLLLRHAPRRDSCTSFSISPQEGISLESACDAFTTASIPSNCPDWRANRKLRRGAEIALPVVAGTVRRVALLFRVRPNGRSSSAQNEDGRSQPFSRAACQAVLRRHVRGRGPRPGRKLCSRAEMDSLLVQTQGVRVSLFDAGDLSRYCTARACRRTSADSFRPLAQLFLVCPKEFAPSLLLSG